MTQTSLLLWSGRFLIFGGILLVSGLNLSPGYSNDAAHFNDPLYFPSAVLQIAGALMILMALPLLYAFQADKGGFFGFLGFLLSFIGLAFFGFAIFFNSFVMLNIDSLGPETQALLNTENHPFSSLSNYITGSLISLSIGFLLLGISGLRSKGYPNAVPMLFIIGAVSTAILPIYPYNFQIGLSLLCLGIILGGNYIIGEAKT
ncbi:MAG: hypothetical protein M3512_08125 [Bacteroidota bacterium]|nr:hypothetical protein [Bacteroidota bacterium]